MSCGSELLRGIWFSVWAAKSQCLQLLPRLATFITSPRAIVVISLKMAYGHISKFTKCGLSPCQVKSYWVLSFAIVKKLQNASYMALDLKCASFESLVSPSSSLDVLGYIFYNMVIVQFF